MCFVLKLRVLTATLLVYPTTPYFDAAYAGAYGIGVKPKKKKKLYQIISKSKTVSRKSTFLCKQCFLIKYMTCCRSNVNDHAPSTPRLFVQVLFRQLSAFYHTNLPGTIVS